MPLQTDTVTLATLSLTNGILHTLGVWVYRFAASPEVKVTVGAAETQVHDTTGWQFLTTEFIAVGTVIPKLVPLTDGTDEIYTDGLIIVEGEIVGDYFDGDTPDAGGYTYSWNGTPHASTSTRTLIEDAETNITISGMTARYFKTAPKTSGPWVGGLGTTGVRFVEKPTWTPYSGYDGDEIGLSANLREVGDGE